MNLETLEITGMTPVAAADLNDALPGRRFYYSPRGWPKQGDAATSPATPALALGFSSGSVPETAMLNRRRSRVLFS
jgi:hypothetical protein